MHAYAGMLFEGFTHRCRSASLVLDSADASYFKWRLKTNIPELTNFRVWRVSRRHRLHRDSLQIIRACK
jgi:hypothetical protein